METFDSLVKKWKKELKEKATLPPPVVVEIPLPPQVPVVESPQGGQQ